MLGELRVMTFNILAPIYKRTPETGAGKRESDDPAVYIPRHMRLISLIAEYAADVVCLQEFWFDSELSRLYERMLGDKYDFYGLQRTNRKSDGVATLVARSLLVVDVQELRMSGTDRVALLLHLSPLAAQMEETVLHNQSFILVNTHLSFNHGGLWDEASRANQAHQITRFIENYTGLNGINEAPVLLCGDLNGSNDVVTAHLQKGGYRACFQMVQGRSDFVTHLTHKHDEMCADHILLRSAEDCPDPSTSSNCGEVRGDEPGRRRSSSGRTCTQLREITNLTLRPVDAYVLPRGLSDTSWPKLHFTISDHRPVCAVFHMETKPILPS